MLAVAEVFGGIEFVRISQLPAEQQEKLKSGIAQDQIIKILKDGELLDGCIQYADYIRWFNLEFKVVLPIAN